MGYSRLDAGPRATLCYCRQHVPFRILTFRRGRPTYVIPGADQHPILYQY